MLSKLNKNLILRKFSTINKFSFIDNNKINELKGEILLNLDKHNNITKNDTYEIYKNKTDNKYNNTNLVDDIAITSIIKNEFGDKLNCSDLNNKIEEFKLLNRNYKVQKDLIEKIIYNNYEKYDDNNDNNVNNELYKKIKYYYILFSASKYS